MEQIYMYTPQCTPLLRKASEMAAKSMFLVPYVTLAATFGASAYEAFWATGHSVVSIWTNSELLQPCRQLLSKSRFTGCYLA